MASESYMFKIIILGDPAVGKTSLIKRYTEGVFSESYSKTIGCDFLVKTLEFDFGNLIMNIWDIAGDSRFEHLLPIYLKDADACIFVFDISNTLSLIHIENWKKKLYETLSDNNRNENIPYIIIGNKSDLKAEISKKKRITEKEINRILPKEKKEDFFYGSAKTGENVEKAFYEIGKRIYNMALKNLI
jgi:small GTP-binding protein